ncbi:MAG TPA: two-component regulator propeller domain-containing protein, partial [Actinomycetota bacterium]|nr:two-component regulator propeller domain-containing protein [Actinomycetota bacterium]
MLVPSRALAEWRSFGLADGLATPSVSAIMEDRSGALWFGSASETGMSRYDGAAWQTSFPSAEGLDSTFLTCMLADRSGNLWFGTLSRGVARYDGVGWTRFSAGDLTSSEITCLFQDGAGAIWVGTQSGINRYTNSATVGTTANGVWKRFTPGVNAPRWVTAIGEDGAGHIWAATNIPDLRRLDGESWTDFANGNLPSQVPHGALSARADGKGRLWFGFWNGVAAYDPSRDPSDPLAWTTFRTGDTLLLQQVKAIEQDHDGNLWFGHERGLSRFDGHLWRDYAVPGNAGVDALHLDTLGNLWVGSPQGVQLFDRVTWELFANGLPGVGCEDPTLLTGLAPGGARAIYQDSAGAIWFGTCGGGVVRRDASGDTTFTGSLPSPYVSAVCADRSGALWFGTDRGATRYDGVTWTTFDTSNGLACDTVQTLSVGPLGRMWFGTTRGLASYDGSSWSTYHISPDGLLGENIHALLADHSGSLWVGTNAGANRFDGQRWIQYPAPELPSTVHAIAEDHAGRIWFGTSDGLRVLDGGSWRCYTSSDPGLKDNWIGSILVDHLGIVWVGTQRGVSRFDGTSWVGVTDAVTGLNLAGLSAGSMWEDLAGDLWFGIPHRAGYSSRPIPQGAVR